MRVLIIDHDDLFLFFLRDCLEEHDFVVSEAMSLDQAKEAISEEYFVRGHFDLIIRHVTAQHVDNSDFMMYLRSHGVDIPVMALLDNGPDQKSDFASYIESLGIKTLARPFQLKDLISCAKSLVRANK